MSTSMFDQGPRQTSKKAITVQLVMEDSVLRGQVFVSQNQRVQDLVNDGRSFIPIGIEMDGKFRLELINKSFIIKVVEEESDIY